jgi:hypothetical protein
MLTAKATAYGENTEDGNGNGNGKRQRQTALLQKAYRGRWLQPNPHLPFRKCKTNSIS